MRSFPIVNNKELKNFGDKSTKEVITNIFDKIGSPNRVGLRTGLLTLLPSSIVMRLLGQNHAGLKALGISTAAGLGGKLLTTPYNYDNRLTFGENLFGKDRTRQQRFLDEKWNKLTSTNTGDGYSPKLSSDLANKIAVEWMADLPNTDKLTLHDMVANTPGFTQPQRDFLHNGIYNAPGQNPNVMDLAGGFMNTVNTVTGGLLPMTTRAVEGALIGSAFGNVLGAQPGTKQFITGAAALVDGLAGNKLFNTISQVY